MVRWRISLPIHILRWISPNRVRNHFQYFYCLLIFCFMFFLRTHPHYHREKTTWILARSTKPKSILPLLCKGEWIRSSRRPEMAVRDNRTSSRPQGWRFNIPLFTTLHWYLFIFLFKGRSYHTRFIQWESIKGLAGHFPWNFLHRQRYIRFSSFFEE